MRSKFKWIFTLSLAFIMQLSFAQEKTVKGIVTDATGPMPGVNVIIKGTQKGVSTGFDGSYAIKANVGDVLVFSFMGMNTVSRTVDASGVANVKMQDDVTKIETVVVTGFGIKRKVDAIVSATTVVKAEELNRASAPNAVQALIGKVSGLQITTTNSDVAGENRVVFRGARTISGNNQALVVIDGAISSLATFQQIPPELVASVTALKGAQGAALYGSDGVNGALIVTTKKGSGDKFTVGVKSSVDLLNIAYLPITQKRYGQGWDGRHATQENGSWGPELDGVLFPTGLPQANGTYVTAPYSAIKGSVLKPFFQTGVLIQNGINVSAGSVENGYVNFSANRQTTDFIVKNDNLQRNSFLVKTGKKIGKLTVEGNFNYIGQTVKQTESGLYSQLLQTAPNIPIEKFEFSGNEGHWNTYNLNPYWLRDNRREQNKSNRFTGIISLDYELSKNFSVKYLANYRLNNTEDLYYRNAYTDITNVNFGGNDASVIGTLVNGNSSTSTFYGDLFLNFNYKLTEGLGLTAVLGQNTQDNLFNVIENGGQNFAIPGVYNVNNILNPYTIAQSTLTGFPLDNRRGVISRKLGVFSELSLNYKDYLFLTATGRNDWSSRFKKSGNSFFYPSVGLSFVPTVAFDGLKNNVLNYMKFSGSWTRVGNDTGVPVFAINQVATLGTGYPFSGQNSYVQALNQTDPNVRPEFVTTAEANVNLGFFNDRLTLDGSIYDVKTTDLITTASVSGSTGFNTLRTNTGDLQTKGFEIDLGFTPIKNGDRGLRWDNKLNYTSYKVKVLKVSGDAKSVSIRQPFTEVGIFAEEGQEFPLIKGQTYAKDAFGRTIVDSFGLPTIDPSFKILGKVNPDYIVGLNSSFSYRGVRLSATMDYRTGHQFFSQTKNDLGIFGNLTESANNRTGFILPNSSFDYNGDNIISANEVNTNVVTGATVPALIAYYGRYTDSAENLVLDATAFKVREASLGYTFTKTAIEKMGLSSLSFSINARNPINIFSKQNKNYSDPESAEDANVTQNGSGGISFTDRYPAQSSYGFAINLTF